MRKLMPLIMVALLPLAACSEGFPVGGDTSIQIRTQPPVTASCLIRSRIGAWDIANTPEHIEVDKSSGPLTVQCHNPQGWEGAVTVQSAISSEGVAQAVIIGGVATGVFAGTQPGIAAGYIAAAGAGLEGASFGTSAIDGSLWKYPREIVVPMHQTIMERPTAVGGPVPVMIAPVTHMPASRRHVVHVRHAPHPTCVCATDHPGS